MIKTLIKRDGRKEPFMAKKANDWGRWADHDADNWSTVVINAVKELPEECTTERFQNTLIRHCLELSTRKSYEMAGRLLASQLHKSIFPKGIPTIQQLHASLQEKGLMEPLNYTDYEYSVIEGFINHELDFETPHFALDYFQSKYAIKDMITEETFETQQFVYMRMAMTLSQRIPSSEERIEMVKRFYTAYSSKRLSAPTPSYINLGTKLRGYASCCLYEAGDTVKSIGIGNWIGYMMTASSAGIGFGINTRSFEDPIRGGRISHMGKLPYYRAAATSIRSNTQAGRGGAGTVFWNCYDPEGEVISQLRNPRSVAEKRNRDLHYAMQANRKFVTAVARNEEVFAFNVHTAPDLFEAMHQGDQDRFDALYEQYENNPDFPKKYFNARERALLTLSESLETGVAYRTFLDTINHNTPYREPIRTSNLCLEILQPSSAYYEMMDLYRTEDYGKVTYRTEEGVRKHTWSDKVSINKLGRMVPTYAGGVEVGDEIDGETVVEVLEKERPGEVSLCSLGAINLSEELTDDEYYELMYLALKNIDYSIYNHEHTLPHVGYTARQRMNAAVGIVGLATHMARLNLPYDSDEGLKELHRIFERHMYMAIKASIAISKERGLAPWIHKTKWVEGWTPIQTANKRIDGEIDFDYQYDWDALSDEIRANGGLAHSSLVAFMPSESSSKVADAANSIYPVRDTALVKTDNGSTIRWAAREVGDDSNYHRAWELDETAAIRFYAVAQKFCDQAPSADFWWKVPKDVKIESTRLIQFYINLYRYGMKTQYYTNSSTSSDTEAYEVLNAADADETIQCAGGACKI